MRSPTQMPIQRLHKRVVHIRNRYFFLWDVSVLALVPAVALVLRVDRPSIWWSFLPALATYTLISLCVQPIVFYGMDLYRRYWRFASADDLVQITKAVLVGGLVVWLVYMSALLFLPPGTTPRPLPRSVPFIATLLVLLGVGGARFFVRLADGWRYGQSAELPIRVAIMGAGSTGMVILRELDRTPQLGLEVVGFFDDNPVKHGLRVQGHPVFGGRERIPEVTHNQRIREIIIALPTASGREVREINRICQSAGLATRTVPGMSELIDGTVKISQLRPVQIEDLLRREPIQTDTTAIRTCLRGRRVLVTGGGGSIGSELCRQILHCGPAELILLGHGENSIFEIEQELRTHLATLPRSEEPPPKLRAIIADIRFAERMESIFERIQPEIVFHAAAHKHVPLMETNPAEAVTNNILGTRNVVQAALKAGVERFVLISTDKAVNPTNVMGASKRAAELLVLDAARRHGKAFVAVRFGNVLGSRGSVLHTFRRQIAAGGPVTVTHPDMRRFFMTIPEAVQLVLQAGVLGRQGDIFMLDMGEPVKIVDLAYDLIRLSGMELGRDIDVVFDGLRPGEKLFEELFVEGERYSPTEHVKIFRVDNASRLVPDDLGAGVTALQSAADRDDRAAIIGELRRLVPEFQPTLIQERPPHSTAAPVKVEANSGALPNTGRPPALGSVTQMP